MKKYYAEWMHTRPSDGSHAEYQYYQDVYLASEVDAHIAELENALRWYAVTLGNSKSMDYRIIHQDGGKKARDALGL